MYLGSLFIGTMIATTVRSFHIPFKVPTKILGKQMVHIMKSGGSSNKHYNKESNMRIVPKYQPATQNQREYVNALDNPLHDLVFGIGPAGCGKTLFACSHAIRQLRLGKIQKVVITRPIITVEEDLGFLPGNVLKKMDPWLQPIFDTFLEYYTQRELDDMLANGTIEVAPIGFMRGRTFKHSLIIADEMQNSSPNQMLMLLTRIGENSRMFVTGDLKQSDRGHNGLADFYSKFRRWNTPNNRVQLVFMNHDDVQRSEIVKSVLNIYGEDDEPKKPEPKAQEDQDDCNECDLDAPSSNEPPYIHPNDDAALIPLSDMSKTL
jgi:phosphate starvation-inducible protein PhoH and related proteins